jgi:predicted tellurium resistance membrane protein TerC
VLEGLLSADNAMVLAVLVLGLPKEQQRQALRYGILGAFAFRIVATVFAAQMIQLRLVQLIGGLYLLWLPYHHFFRGGDAQERRTPPQAKAWLGMSAFGRPWSRSSSPTSSLPSTRFWSPWRCRRNCG